MLPGNEWNPKGYFENQHLYDYLQHCALFLENPVIKDNFRSGIKDHCNVPDNGPWFLKHPGILVIAARCGAQWPQFHTLFPNAKWVIARRHSIDIFKSIRHFHSENPLYKDWTEECLDQIPKLKASGVNYREIWPLKDLNKERMMEEYETLISELGLEWNEAAVREFIDVSVCHHCSAEESPKESLESPAPADNPSPSAE